MIKMDKKVAVLIIIVEDHSILMYLVGIIFSVLKIQLSSLLPQKQVSIDPTDFRWVFAM